MRGVRELHRHGNGCELYRGLPSSLSYCTRFPATWNVFCKLCDWTTTHLRGSYTKQQPTTTAWTISQLSLRAQNATVAEHGLLPSGPPIILIGASTPWTTTWCCSRSTSTPPERCVARNLANLQCAIECYLWQLTPSVFASC